MLPSPRLNLIEQPDPPHPQVTHWHRKVRPQGKTMHLLTRHPQQIRELRDARKPEAIHNRRLGTTCPLAHEMGNLRHLLPSTQPTTTARGLHST